MDLAVRLEGVHFAYRGVSVLKGASLSLAPGELCALIGPNGAGKSTVIRLILGEIVPAKGTVEVLGRTPADACAARAVGYVPQQAPDDYRHFPATVAEVIGAMLPGTLLSAGWRSRRVERKAAVQRALASVEIEDLAKRPIGELSGGQFQRALLARALVSEPQLLLLDEPTSNLDEKSADSLVHLVSDIAKETGAAVLLVTHDLARLPRLFDRVAHLDRGFIDLHAPTCTRKPL